MHAIDDYASIVSLTIRKPELIGFVIDWAEESQCL